MNITDLQSAILAPLFTSEGDPVLSITDPGDRRRLMTLITMEPDLIHDLKLDALDAQRESALITGQTTTAMMCIACGDVPGFAAWAAMQGANFYQRLYEEIGKFIDANAEEWLALLRGEHMRGFEYTESKLGVLI